ncbi:MAG TPA: PAS domain-containing protein [Verrucomicrobiae bacterium]
MALLLANASGAETRRVLVVHSFVNTVPPFTMASSAFETELTTKLGAPVDLDEISLNLGRYSGPEMEDALVEFMRQRRTKWQPHLVVPFGSPSAAFIAQHRDRLFPTNVPVVYTGLDERRLPSNALAYNAAFVGHHYDLPGLVDDILQLAPDTRNIGVVIGASPVEQIWKGIAQKDFAKFTNRIEFTWFDHLSFPEMLDRAATMPRQSFLLMILLVRDVKGVSLNANEALQHLHQVANAPINSIFKYQLGLGIVGGRLYDEEAVARHSAHTAIRILGGESTADFPPKVLAPAAPTYDARELKRWKIAESRLPPGSTVHFREATIWQKYPGRVVAVLAIFLAQALSILALVLNISTRRRMEAELRESQKRMTLAADAASMGMLMWETTKQQMWTSEKWKEIHGYDPKENVTYPSFISRVHPDDLEVLERAIKDALDRKTEFLVQHRVIRPDGNVRWISKHGRIESAGRNGSLRVVGVSIDITEHVNAQSAAREVSGRLINAQEDERKRIARDLHDDLNQRLAVLSMEADMLAQINHAPDAEPLIKEITTQVKSLATEIHNLSYQLHPAKLEQLGLVAATRALCTEQSNVWAMPIDFVQAGVPRELNANTSLVMYRITQEALHNIGKHSKANRARVELTRHGDVICLMISDDGQGFDMSTVSLHQGLGLVGMRERVYLAHGHMEIQSAPGKGTTIEVRIPLFEEPTTLKKI